MATDLGGTHKSYGSSVNCILIKPHAQNTINASPPKMDVIGFPLVIKPSLKERSRSIQINSAIKY